MSQIDLGKVVGSRIHNVTGAPSTSLGLVNDWAMDTTNGDVYEKTGSSTWTKRGNFKGEQGIQGIQGPKGDTGAPFAIAKTYPSIAAMNADFSGTDVHTGEFVLIDTEDVQDPDNAKLYYKGSSAWVYCCDLSGATGIQGPQGPQGPQGIQGETGATGATGADGTAAGFGTVSATVNDQTGTPGVTVTTSGTNAAKNFAFAFTNLKGAKGDTGSAGAAGKGITSIAKTGTSGLVDTYTITFTDATTTTFTVTNGADGADGADGITPTFSIDASGHLIATYS